MSGILSDQQRTELIAQMLQGGLRRVTAGPTTTEFIPPSTTELMKLLALDNSSAAIAANRRPFRIQVQVSPGAV